MLMPEYIHWHGRGDDESLDQYSARALYYVLDHYVLDDMSDEDLDTADRAARIGTTAKAISPAALEVLSSAIKRIQLLLKARRDTPKSSSGAPAGRDLPNQGPMAPLHDRPLVQPPSGQKVEVQF